jgi:hypothetical protein
MNHKSPICIVKLRSNRIICIQWHKPRYEWVDEWMDEKHEKKSISELTKIRSEICATQYFYGEIVLHFAYDLDRVVECEVCVLLRLLKLDLVVAISDFNFIFFTR